MRTHRSIWFALALVCAAAMLNAPATHAQDALDAEPDTSFMAGEPGAATIGFTLDQAQRLAAENNPAARAVLASLRSARGARMREVGNFDPALFGEGSRTSANSPVSSPFAPSELRQEVLLGGATWRSPIGTSLLVSLSQTQTETNAPFSTLSTERRTHARFDFVQPLTRGFGMASARGELRALDREVEAATRRLEAATLDLQAAVETAYWQLYASERDLQVQRLQRQRSAVFLRDQMIRSRAGATGPGAVAAARRFLAEQEVLLIDANLRYRAASDRLNEVLGIPAASQERLHSLDEPPPPGEVMPLETAIDLAYRRNGALRAFEADSAAALARYRRAARDAWPSIDAFGGYGGSGLAGVGRSDTLNVDPDFGDAWNQVWDDAYPDWSVGVRVQVPIGWRSERGERELQRGLYERASEATRAQRLSIENQVRIAHREAEQSIQALRAMQALAEAAREQARIGRLEYQAGRTTPYDLVDIETELVRAELQETQVLVRVVRAATEMRRLTNAPPEIAK